MGSLLLFLSAAVMAAAIIIGFLLLPLPYFTLATGIIVGLGLFPALRTKL